ncbi:pol polyprotein [Tanacetum coccineum]
MVVVLDRNILMMERRITPNKINTTKKSLSLLGLLETWAQRYGCRHKKEHGGENSRGNSNQANHVEYLKEFAGVIESFLTTNVVDWLFDTGATKHKCNSRRMFVSYQKVNEPDPMFMRKETASKIDGKGNKFCYMYLINFKDEALNMCKTYKAEVENLLDKKIKILRSDKGGEYESNDFAEFCSTFGIVHQTTTPYTSQQNGVAERKNRTLKNMIIQY